MTNRVAAVALAFAAPISAEFLLGDQYLIGPPSPRQFGMLALFAAFYGCGAILVRELARRAGRGWPTILLLALAFGLIEEGLLTQSLFNPNYAGARLLDYGFVPALGIAAPWTVFVLTLHVVWSLGAPIGVVEAAFPGRQPWLGRLGLGISAGLYVLGAAASFAISLRIGGGFLAHPAQLVVIAVLAAALIVLAFRLPRQEMRRPATLGQLPGFAFGLLGTTAFQLLRMLDTLPAWLMTVLLLALELAAVLAVARWRPGVFGLAAGALCTYCWVGMRTALAAGPAAVAEQVVLVAVTLVLLGLVTLRAGLYPRAREINSRYH